MESIFAFLLNPKLALGNAKIRRTPKGIPKSRFSFPSPSFFSPLSFPLLLSPSPFLSLLPPSSNFLSSTAMVYQKRPKSIMITGCDSGFGKAIAERFASKGHRVFAGCLTQEGVKSLSHSAPSIFSFLLDVTNPIDVQKAADLVASHSPEGLHGLVNNAGIFLGSMIEWSDIEDYRKMMEVNFFGLVSVTKAFIPLIKKGLGTIVNITSTAGVLVFPTMAGYSSSKFAAEAFSDGLRRELSPFGVKVAVIEPVVMKTPIVQFSPMFEETWRRAPLALKEEYGEAFYQNMLARLKELEGSAQDPVLVVNAVEETLMSKHPRNRVLVGPIYQTVMAKIPSWLFDSMIRALYMCNVKQPLKSKL